MLHVRWDTLGLLLSILELVHHPLSDLHALSRVTLSRQEFTVAAHRHLVLRWLGKAPE